MTTVREQAIAFVLTHEGGWWPGGPRDPNPTMQGVTQRTYDEFRRERGHVPRSVREITGEERDAIYTQFWDASQADHLPPRPAVAHFSFAFNAGPTAAAKTLQRALGVTPDGRLGPVTRAAMAAATDTLLPVLLLEQLDYYHQVARPPRMRANLFAWTGRLTGAWRLTVTTTPLTP